MIWKLSSIISLFFSVNVWATAGITYHGRIFDPGGNPVTSANVTFKIQLRSPGAENCLLYEETQVKNMSTTNGGFSLTINDGTGTRTDLTGLTLQQIFANRGTLNFSNGECATGNSYSPGAADGRKLVAYFNDSIIPVGQWEPIPAQLITQVPEAIESLQVGGYKPDQLLRLADGVSTAMAELTSQMWTDLLALIAGTSNKYVKPTDSIAKLGSANIPASFNNGESMRWNTALNAGSGGWEVFTPSAGTLNSITAGTGLTGGTITTSGTIAVDVGTTASKVVQLDSSARLPAVDGSQLTSVNASKVGGTTVSLAALANGQVLKYNGTNWANAADADTMGGLSCASGSLAYFVGASWSCITVTTAKTANTVIARGASNAFTAGIATLDAVKFDNGATTAQVTLSAPFAFTSYSLVLPTTFGTSGQMLTSDGTGNLVWASPATNGFVNGGNSFAAAASLGTNDAFDLSLKTNNVSRMAISSTGQVAIGTATDTTNALKVGGNIRQSVGQITSAAYDAGSGVSFDLNNGNVQYTSANCQAMSLSNMQDGGAYTIVVKGTTSGTCSFSHSGLTFWYSPATGASASGSMSTYTFLRVGNDVMVTWISLYQ
ncbi:MAG TPA: hypothetical protein PLU50_02400 [Pseudobdellovibrionaceae bacterium]|nr:hypothetical protein [Pseudobdellovibrionaceae bacterium]